MELTCLGHATLLVTHGARRLLCDPMFARELSGGGNVIYPYRRVDLDALGALDAILLSHHHSDHFALDEIARLPRAREQRFVVPAGSPLVKPLRAWGATRVDEVRPGQTVTFGELAVTMTPSAAPFPEMGFLFRHDDVAALNLVDTRLDGALAGPALLALLPPRLSLVLAPFQAGGYQSLWPLRVGGPPRGLVERIARSAHRALAQLVADLARMHPEHVATFADGIVYRDPQVNAWHFPLPDEAFVAALAAHGIAGSSAEAGACFEVSKGGVRRRGADPELVTTSRVPALARDFDPGVALDEVPIACHALGARPRPPTAIDVPGLAQRLGIDLQAKLDSMGDGRAAMAAALQDWFIELCDVTDEARFLVPEIHGAPARLRVASAPPAGRQHGLVLHGADVELVLTGALALEHLKFSGALRYRSPPVILDEDATEHALFLPLYVLASWENEDPNSEDGVEDEKLVAAADPR